MGAPPLSQIEQACVAYAKAVTRMQSLSGRMPTPSPTMSAQQARMVQIVAEHMALVADCMDMIATLRLKELKDAAEND